MFPDKDDISSTGNKQQFPPPWLKQNPRVTMKMHHSPEWSKCFLIPGDNNQWEYLVGRTRRTSSRYIFTTTQLQDTYIQGDILRGHRPLITKSHSPTQPDHFQSTIETQKTIAQPDLPRPPPPLRIVDKVLSSYPDHVTLTKDKL